MKTVAKYNIFKGVSTLLTLGTPIVTLSCCSEFFVHRSDTAISAAGIFAILICILLFKDKLMERWKMPSAFVVSLAMLIVILLLENIIIPIKYVSIATVISTGADELTFQRLYKGVELQFPKEVESFKHLGFLFVSTDRLSTIVDKQGG